MKAPDNNVLEFALSKKVILVEGDAEFILIEKMYKKYSGGNSPQADEVHIISIGGTSFKRYLELAKLLGKRVAAIRDNDTITSKTASATMRVFSMKARKYLPTLTILARPLRSRSMRTTRRHVKHSLLRRAKN